MACSGKHTKYQPTNEEFSCPKCGAEFGDFCKEEPSPDSSENCELLHEDDELACMKCGYGVRGKTFANALVKMKNLEKCPHCKGTGFVKRPS